MKFLNYTTKVQVNQSIMEIQQMLAKAGAKAVMHGYDDDGNISAISFSMLFNGRTVGFRLPGNWPAVQQILLSYKGLDKNWRPVWATDQQSMNVTWRVIKDWVEAQLALIQANQTKPHQPFLPYAITASGKTLAEEIEENPSRLLGSG